MDLQWILTFDVNCRHPFSAIHLLTCELFHSGAQLANVLPQVRHPGEGVFLQLKHVIGTAAAASLAVEGAVAVPRDTGQRSLTDCDV